MENFKFVTVKNKDEKQLTVFVEPTAAEYDNSYELLALSNGNIVKCKLPVITGGTLNVKDGEDYKKLYEDLLKRIVCLEKARTVTCDITKGEDNALVVEKISDSTENTVDAPEDESVRTRTRQRAK